MRETAIGCQAVDLLIWNSKDTKQMGIQSGNDRWNGALTVKKLCQLSRPLHRVNRWGKFRSEKSLQFAPRSEIKIRRFESGSRLPKLAGTLLPSTHEEMSK